MNTPIYSSFAQANNTLHDLQPVDYFLAKEVCEALLINTNYTTAQQALVFHLVVALSQHVFNGHTCLPLNTIANIRMGFESDKDGHIVKQGYNFPDIHTITTCVEQLSLHKDAEQLLVLQHGSIYLRRYAIFENELAQQLHDRMIINTEFNPQAIQQVVETLFPNQVTEQSEQKANDEVDWQKVAVANALNKNFSVIAGGPGTGKTYTVTKLLAALVMLKQQENTTDTGETNKTMKTMRFALAAPTGKAAQRLSESITQAVKQFDGAIDTNVLQAIPTQALTIHRLLGYIPNSPNFRHNENNLLAIDFLLIDEASMVDLALLTRIFRALPAHAKVVLLGDADQLPSVAVGNVLADIAPRPHAGYSKNNQTYLKKITQHALVKNTKSTVDYLTFLLKSRRFDGEGGIGLLAKAVIAGEAKASWKLLSQHAVDMNNKSIADLDSHYAGSSDASEQKPKQLGLLQPVFSNGVLSNEKTVGQQPLNNNELLSSAAFISFIETFYTPLFHCETPQAALHSLHQFRILCATRVGAEGVDAINIRIIEHFQQKGLLSSTFTPQSNTISASVLPNIYHAMPILVLENHHKLGIYNGDIGIIWKNEEGHLMAVFESDNNEQHPSGVYSIIPSRLPKFQPVYAMTTHKTQGSEFNNVLMVLPQQRDNKLLSRELLYTGITRAKQHITIASLHNVWQQAVETKVIRYSNLSLIN